MHGEEVPQFAPTQATGRGPPCSSWPSTTPAGKAECLPEGGASLLQNRTLQLSKPLLRPLPTLEQTSSMAQPRALLRLAEQEQPSPPPRSCPLPHPGDLTLSEWPIQHKLNLGRTVRASYTDGSRLEEKDGSHSIGAGIYSIGPDGAETTIRLNPSAKKAYMNTITKAELEAIYFAIDSERISPETLHIYTDSLASIHLISQAIRSPTWSLLTENKHAALLTRIQAALIARSQNNAHTHIYKVRSHTGVHGNEMADRAANEAAKEPSKCDAPQPEGASDDPYGQRPWIATKPKPSKTGWHRGQQQEGQGLQPCAPLPERPVQSNRDSGGPHNCPRLL